MHPTERFTSRVAAYARWRPSYPREAIDLLRERCGLGPEAIVADVGAGTGIFSALLLDTGARVYAVEPNAAMREAALALLGDRAQFHAIDGTAEHTTLTDASCMLVAAAQAFHWFDREAARREFRRILRPGGSMALVWNERNDSVDTFHVEYERLLQRFGTDYAAVDHRRVDRARLEAFFAPARMTEVRVPYVQELPWEGLLGRCFSSSYVPLVDTVLGQRLATALRELFDRHARGGVVKMVYETKVFFGG